MKLRSIEDRFMTGLIVSSGVAVILIVVAILYYLGSESKYAFDQGFGYGYKFALTAEDVPSDYSVEFDPNASLLASNSEGDDGIDEKEEDIFMPTLADLRGFATCATGAAHVSQVSQVGAQKEIYRDDWRSLKPATHADRYFLVAFATSEHTGRTMTLRWMPDASYDAALAPYDIRLELVKSPQGVTPPDLSIDLTEQSTGSVVLPTYIARTDEERANGYVFEMSVRPKTNNFFATMGNFLRQDWAPTLVYPRFGFVPLFLGTLAMVATAILIAAPVSVLLAVYLSEVGKSRATEFLKPVIELLASVPTVVLGYFGVMLLAPYLQDFASRFFQIESGRMMLTASIVLAVLLIPVMTTVAEDALRNVPNFLRDGATALGLTRREAIRTVVLPAAKRGVTAALLLGLSRGVGETMIIWMLSGGTARMPQFGNPAQAAENFFKPASGIPDRIGTEMGNVAFESAHYGHLFLLGLSLYVVNLFINLYGYRMARRAAWQA